LLLEGVHLDLVDCGRNLVERHDIHQAVRMEVADADGAHFPGTVGVFHCAPGTMDVAERLVDQVEVQIVELQPMQRLLDGLLRALVAGVL
jgi:hypothetical protein